MTDETCTNSANKPLIEQKVIEVLRSCFDPEIPVNIYDLGLIYEITVEESGSVDIKMTLTAPACPVAGTLPQQVEERVGSIPEVTDARVQLVWDPPWCSDKMSDAAKLQLNLL